VRGVLVDVSASAVRAAVEGVLDPEMPPVTIGELGMVLDVRVEAAAEGDPAGVTAVVEVMPTMSSCPAIPYIGADVEAAARSVEGVADVVVRWRRDVAWGPERITEAGRAKLAGSGIAPPGSGQTLLSIGGVRCPHCGSRNTRADSPFGSAPCRSTHSCRDCKTPFDAIKPI
jgi:ring-1,2-phenylacetyl-CoA epoxidase subunit PaaD